MNNFSDSGEFFIGCNYWASHAGIHMWTDWDADVVEDDFKRLSNAEVTTIRVFPLWPVFQPICILRGGMGIPREYRFAEKPLPDDENGAAGLSAEALARFGELCKMAEKYNIRLIVGLLTGWMSGRMFIPPALDGLNVLTDPTAIMWQIRFVRRFVKLFNNEPSITAWDLGNECNVMGEVKSADEFYIWAANIVGAIKSSDPSRPVISGMHSLLPDNLWTIQHQAELNDYLTTHPYPYYTPHSDVDPINSMRTVLHAAAETLFYRGIGGKPCFVEECGTLGPMFADDETASDFVRANLFTQWAHDCRGFLWWCANDMSHLSYAPYDWHATERELGLFRKDGSGKPMLNEMTNFAKFLNQFEYKTLPPRITDGICVLTRGQDTWGAAYMSFILAKQAGLDIEFAYSTQALPDAPLYILPSISGDIWMSGSRFNELLEKVKNGAVLYLSMDNGLISSFSDIFGMKVITRKKTGYIENIILQAGTETFTLPLFSSYKLKTEPVSASVSAYDAEGTPAFSVNDYGRGKIYFLSFPMETELAKTTDAFGSESQYAEIYKILKKSFESKKNAYINNKNVGLTEHILTDNKRLLVMINYNLFHVETNLILNEGWHIKKYIYGNKTINKNDAAIIDIGR